MVYSSFLHENSTISAIREIKKRFFFILFTLIGEKLIESDVVIYANNLIGFHVID
jgi:hypothetical protein